MILGYSFSNACIDRQPTPGPFPGESEEFMDIYVCNLCGYEYDPAVGDPENGIAPGTAFEDLPDTWVCPLCGASKEDFSKK